MTFLPPDDAHRARLAVQNALGTEGIDVLLWRRVLVGPMALSLKGLFEEHLEWTGLERAAAILERWSEAREQFWVVRPQPPRSRNVTAETDSSTRA